MPIYEYLCLDCSRVSSHLVMSVDRFEPHCKWCQGKRVKKLVSRVHVRLSEETRLERAMDPLLMGQVDEDDPKSIKKMMNRMGGLMGDDFDGDFNEMVEEAVEEAASSTESVATDASAPAASGGVEGGSSSPGIEG